MKLLLVDDVAASLKNISNHKYFIIKSPLSLLLFTRVCKKKFKAKSQEIVTSQFLQAFKKQKNIIKQEFIHPTVGSFFIKLLSAFK